MRLLSIPLLLLLFALPSTALAAQTVVLQSRPLKAGIKIVETESLSFALEIQLSSAGAPMGSFAGTQDEITTRSQKILVWDDDHRRLQVTFDEFTRRETSRDPAGLTSSEDPTSPLTGSTYIVDWTLAGGVTVGALDDGAVPEAQASEVKGLYEDLGEDPNEMAQLLGGQRLVVGEPVDIPPSALAKLLGGGGDDFSYEEFKMVLLEKRKIHRKPCAVFSVHLVMTMEDDGLRMLGRMTGEVALSIREGWLVALELRGPLAAEGRQDGLGLQGGGTMAESVTRSYGK